MVAHGGSIRVLHGDLCERRGHPGFGHPRSRAIEGATGAYTSEWSDGGLKKNGGWTSYHWCWIRIRPSLMWLKS